MTNLNPNPRYDPNASRTGGRNVTTMEPQRPRPVESTARRPGTQDLVSRGYVEPADEDIRLRAYQIFVERGATPGHEVDDWLQAERELRQRRRQT